MPQGSKEKYTEKQKRMAEHIEEGYEERGVPEDEAERRAWATVNKQTGGGRKGSSGTGRGRSGKSSKSAKTGSGRKKAA
jgi:plasmid stabilization system protein ParE